MADSETGNDAQTSPEEERTTPRDVADAHGSDDQERTRGEDTPAARGDAGRSDRTERDNQPAPEPDSDDDGEDFDDRDNSLEDEQVEKFEKIRRNLRKKNRENENLRGRLKEAETRANRLEIAMNAGLPASLLKFLHGSSQEEMEENAQELLAELGYSSRVTPPGLPQEAGGNPRRGGVDTAAQETDLDKIGGRIYRR